MVSSPTHKVSRSRPEAMKHIPNTAKKSREKNSRPRRTSAGAQGDSRKGLEKGVEHGGGGRGGEVISRNSGASGAPQSLGAGGNGGGGGWCGGGRGTPWSRVLNRRFGRLDRQPCTGLTR